MGFELGARVFGVMVVGWEFWVRVGSLGFSIEGLEFWARGVWFDSVGNSGLLVLGFEVLSFWVRLRGLP